MIFGNTTAIKKQILNTLNLEEIWIAFLLAPLKTPLLILMNMRRGVFMYYLSCVRSKIKSVMFNLSTEVWLHEWEGFSEHWWTSNKDK